MILGTILLQLGWLVGAEGMSLVHSGVGPRVVPPFSNQLGAKLGVMESPELNHA